MRLTDYKALSFDCYGTLIDWESGMIEGLSGLTARVQKELNSRCDSGGACAPRIRAAAPDPSHALL